MIDVKDLRIGNLLLHKGKIVDVTEITNYGRICVTDEKIVTEVKNCEPIPLTEDWLLKAGFEKLEKVNRYFKYIVACEPKNLDYRQFAVDFRKGKFIFNIRNGFEIKYLHQLQNLYRDLTGNDLIFEL